MSAFEIVTFAVAVIAIVVAVASYLQMTRVIDRLGHSGHTWFDHADDLHVSARPSEDDRDDPLPRRPLRGRPE